MVPESDQVRTPLTTKRRTLDGFSVDFQWIFVKNLTVRIWRQISRDTLLAVPVGRDRQFVI